jgi:hypothetical protein
MRKRWDVMLESVKVRTETEKIAYRRQYEKEYTSYEKLWAKLHHIEQMMELLSLDLRDTGMDEFLRRKHMCKELINGFAVEVQLYKPFYNSGVFQDVCLVSEALSNIMFRLDNEEVLIGCDILREFKQRMELLCVSIQDRIFLRFLVSKDTGSRGVDDRGDREIVLIGS